jgi:hypothetical protein
MTMDSIAHLRATRRYVTSMLLNLPIQSTETSIATFLVMLDHFSAYPDEYLELLNDHKHEFSTRKAS